MNTNLIHNILNALVVATASIELLDLAPILGAENALKVVIVAGVSKILINFLRDGLAGMAKEQPPVV